MGCEPARCSPDRGCRTGELLVSGVVTISDIQPPGLSSMSLMLSEIRQQPDVLEGILTQPPGGLAELQRQFSKCPPSVIAIVARGTSAHAALFARYLFEIVLHIPTLLAAPSISTLYRRQSLPEDALLIGVSQSGESTDINEYAWRAAKAGIHTVGITNEEASTLASVADVVLPTLAGTEESVAATKTYTAQLLMFYQVAQALGAGVPDGALRRIPDVLRAQLDREAEVEHLARQFRAITCAVVLGRGLNYATSREFALKLMETCYVMATGFSAADFAHGPMAVVEPEFPVFVFASSGPTSGEMAKLVDRLHGEGVATVGIGAQSMLASLRCSKRIELHGGVPQPEGFPRDLLTPIPSILPAQLFAAYLAASKGLDPDQPRMLSKITRTM